MPKNAARNELSWDLNPDPSDYPGWILKTSVFHKVVVIIIIVVKYNALPTEMERCSQPTLENSGNRIAHSLWYEKKDAWLIGGEKEKY